MLFRSSFILLRIFKKIEMNENMSIVMTSIFLIFFSFVASFTPSILRTVIFFILSNINKVYYFYIKPKNILYLTFIILIIINPFYIYNIGFILSFTITYFILLFNENNTIKNGIKSILVISLLSFLSSLPIIINMSYEVNIISSINNIFFIPFATNIVFPIAIISVIIPDASYILNILTTIMEYISNISSKVINITIYFPYFNKILIFFYYLFLILFIKLNKKKYLFLIFLILLFLKLKFLFDKSTTLYFLDVGQGDSLLIKTKNNKSIMIDTGGSIKYKREKWEIKNRNFNMEKNIIIPFIKSIGVSKIDYLFLTHGDEDHCGNSKSLIDNFNVRNVYLNKGNINNCEKNTNGIVFDKYYMKIDNIEIYSLNDNEYNDENSSSMVLLVIIDNYKVLVMGDAPVKVENEIVKKENLNKIDFLKVGHHGSNTSSGKEFINYIKPRYSIISVGKNNKFGHPKESVLNTLSNSKIYRTDIDGTIEIKINNNDYVVKNYSP